VLGEQLVGLAGQPGDHLLDVRVGGGLVHRVAHLERVDRLELGVEAVAAHVVDGQLGSGHPVGRAAGRRVRLAEDDLLGDPAGQERLDLVDQLAAGLVDVVREGEAGGVAGRHPRGQLQRGEPNSTA
jgi:hypothetical protein